MNSTYSFDKNRRESEADAQQPFWERIYKRVFDEQFCDTKINFHDLDLQRGGVDRTIITKDGIEHHAEEKLRRLVVRSNVFPDVATELFSSGQQWGWPYRALVCELFTYVQLTRASDIAVVWRYSLLHKAALRCRQSWMNKVWDDGKPRWENRVGHDGFCSLLSHNGTHDTLGLCIPFSAMFAVAPPLLKISGFTTAVERLTIISQSDYPQAEIRNGDASPPAPKDIDEDEERRKAVKQLAKQIGGLHDNQNNKSETTQTQTSHPSQV